MEDLLEGCGVRRDTLTDEERSALDERGFVVLRGLAEGSALRDLCDAFERTVGQEPVVAGKQSGTRHADELVTSDGAFDVAFSHPRVLAAAHHVLRAPFHVMLLGARDPLPGFGAQGLHADWMPRTPSDPVAVVTALWMLDDFTAESGATRVVPGSHRMPGMVPRQLAQPGARHPDEVVVTGIAGSALVFNGHLWHAGRENASNVSRRALQLQFVASAFAPPGTGHRELPQRVAPEVRALLDGTTTTRGRARA